MKKIITLQDKIDFVAEHTALTLKDALNLPIETFEKVYEDVTAMIADISVKETTKINKIAEQYANLISEKITETIKKGKNTFRVEIKGDLIYNDITTRVLTILKNNGFYAISNWRFKYIYIAW